MRAARDDTTLTRRRDPELLTSGPSRRYLMVFDGTSASLFSLPQSGCVIVGRGHDAQLQLADPAASRRHAQLDCGPDAVTLLDLGSHNGTFVNGERLAGPRLLASRDVLTLCDATLVFHCDGGGTRQRPLLDLPRLQERLEEEIERSLHSGGPLSLVCLDLGPVLPDPARVASALLGTLRLMDVAALHGSELLVLLPDVGEDEAATTAADLLRALQAAFAEARGGLCCCFRDGCDADTLLAGARAAAAGAVAGQVADAGAAARTIEVGGHTLLIADPAMARLYALLERLAGSDLPVVLCGETGCGKELAALALHEGSPRRGQRLVTLNCAALPESLAEAELFGVEKGAFSGAHAARAGLIESAHGGTLFLDEVGELPLLVQAKLLRALETRKVVRLGEVRERPADVRILSATHRRLEDEVAAGRFRQDLLYRLRGALLTLPPLRDRRRELGLLARHFLKEACLRVGREDLSLSPFALQKLHAHQWPGNLRELKNAMNYVASTCMARLVEPWHLPDEVTGQAGPLALAAQGDPVPTPLRPLEEEIRELERTRIAEALRRAGGVQTRAAELLSMPLRTFSGKIRLYGLLDQAHPHRSRKNNET